MSPDLHWTDCTAYSRGERGSAPATTFEALAGPVRLVVTCSHIYYRPGWAGSWAPFEPEMWPLDAETLEDAQREVYARAVAAAREAADALGAI